MVLLRIKPKHSCLFHTVVVWLSNGFFTCQQICDRLEKKKKIHYEGKIVRSPKDHVIVLKQA